MTHYYILIQRLSRIFASVLLVIALSLSNDVHAQANTHQELNKSEAVKKAQQQIKGRVLKVDRHKTTYRVKMLQKSGRVISVDVDKRSGKVSTNKSKKEK
jgi:uncharacterized membrane protein YkoI